jgi:hypothetical protein
MEDFLTSGFRQEARLEHMGSRYVLSKADDDETLALTSFALLWGEILLVYSGKNSRTFASNWRGLKGLAI